MYDSFKNFEDYFEISFWESSAVITRILMFSFEFVCTNRVI